MWQWLGFEGRFDWTKARWFGGALGAAILLVGLFLAALAVAAFVHLAVYFFSAPQPAADGTPVAMRFVTVPLLIALFGGPFVVWRAVVAQQQADVAKQSHITDQINKAVEALGAEKSVSRIGRPVEVSTATDSDTRIEWQGEDLPLAKGEEVIEQKTWQAFAETVPNTEVRIGAIYALERIARYSVDDHVPIMEILTAYIRQNAPANTAEDYPEQRWKVLSAYASPEQRKEHETAQKARFGDPPWGGRARDWARRLKADTITQAAIRVIARRSDAQIAEERGDIRYGKEGYRLDLRETNLQAVDVSGLNLSRALLNGARLEGATLQQTQLDEADLGDARMEGANLRSARMEGANLRNVRMEGADLLFAHMNKARLFLTHLEGANLRGAHMEGAGLFGANMEGANLRGAHMEGSEIEQVHFSRSIALSGAYFRGAALTSVNLALLDLDPNETGELSVLLSETFGDRTVSLPDGVPRPAHWSDQDLDEFTDFRTQWRAFQESIGYTPPD